MDLSYAIAYDSETYGQRKLVTGYGSKPWAEFAAETPMNDQAKADLIGGFEHFVRFFAVISRARAFVVRSR